MSDIEDLNPEHMFDHLKNIFNEKAEDKEEEENYLQKRIIKAF
jgi:hypothetical protein